jgi:hypothetical protein
MGAMIWEGSHLLVDGRQGFAVSAPRRVELHHDVLAGEHDVGEGVGCQDLDWAIVGGGSLLALDESHKLASLCVMRYSQCILTYSVWASIFTFIHVRSRA